MGATEVSRGDGGAAAPTEAFLVTLAIVNVNWEDRRQSYLDNFVPFVTESLRRGTQDSYDPAEAKALLEKHFGLRLPVQIVESLLRRATRAESLTKANKRYSLNGPSSAQLDAGIARLQADLMRSHRQLVEALVEFARHRFDVDWEPQGAEDALLGFVEGHSTSLLASAVAGTSYKLSTPITHRREYIVGNFILMLWEKNRDGFASLERLVKGSMLAASLYIADPFNAPRKFRDTALYLDTPVCLKLLGFEGPDAELASAESIALARSQGAEICAFSHTVQEMEAVLEAVKSGLRRTPNSGAFTRGVLDYCRKQGLSESDVTLMIERLPAAMKQKRIEVRDKPRHEVLKAVDEGELERVMQERVGYVRSTTRNYDLDSLTAIHRIRHGESSSHLETSRAVLVTDNHHLVGAARQFFRREQHRFPVAIEEHELAALVWVKEPRQAPELPQRQIIADCLATLAPSQAHWERVVAEVDRLKDRGDLSEADVTLLINANEAQRTLMDVTLGDPVKVSEATVREALERLHAHIRRPVEAKVDAAERAAEAAREMEAGARFERDQAEGEAHELQSKLEELLRQRDSQQRYLAQRAERWARSAERACLVVGGILLVAGIVLPFLPRVQERLPIPGIVFSGLFVLAALLAALSLIFGWNLATWLAKFRAWMRGRLLARFMRAQGFTSDDYQ